MNKDLRGIILQYSSITDSRYKALLESTEVDISESTAMLEPLNSIESSAICNELYGQGLMLVTNVGNFCVVSRSKSTENLFEMVRENPVEAIEHIKSDCHVYRQVNESVMSQLDMDKDPQEGDFYKDKSGTVYVVADVSTRHVAMFDIKNKLKVETYGGLKGYTKVTNNKEFIQLSKKFERVTEGSKYLNYALNEATQTTAIPTKKETIKTVKVNESDIVGKAFEFEDGVFVVTDEIDGMVYLIGPDDELYQMSREDFDDEVGDEVSDDEDINEAVKSDIKSQVTDVMIRHWIAKNRGMSDSQWQKFAERLSAKFGWSFDEIDDEWKRQVDILSDLYDKDRAKYNQVKKAAENKKELVF